ncbi:AMP-binding protein [Lipingzhangella sp. LS1_29]|uniref:Acyl-CoA synthetase n=1 Tax=Lipingzhangella rawalii TaxID=2055835 RepID=A0ABU2H6F7_9ACTN|nr:AMP-binding protein [Lipingzhangella rawalii]MDS1270893.1 AMP-binding protein [Lipingzhangella rawalii]
MAQRDIAAERASVNTEIAGQTLVDWLRRAAEDYGELPALSDRIEGSETGSEAEWSTHTWAQYRQAALDTAAAFVATGLQPGEVAALMLSNRSEHVIADTGTVHAGGVPLTVYATFSPEQIDFVVQDCQASVAVLEGAAELQRWSQALANNPRLHTVVLLDPTAVPASVEEGRRYVSWADFIAEGARAYAADPAAVTARMEAIRPEDPATLLYTSGTTGNPKGVFETHHQILFQCTISLRANNTPAHAITLCYLPLAHIAERVLSIYMPLKVVGHLHFCPDLTRLGEFLGLVRPHGLFGVPRVWEKMQARLTAALEAAPEEQRTAIQQASEVARRYLEQGQYGRSPDAELSAKFAEVDAQVLAPIRALIGLDRAEFCLTAAAPMPEDTVRFFAGLGLLVRDLYGMTENCGAVTINRPEAYRLGSVGPPSEGIEVRIADDGEILVRGPINVSGYHNRPEDSAALVDDDGWLHTGDVGHLDEDNFLYVMDRKKELIVTAGGENIAPAAIESRLKEHPLVGQALAYGDNRPYPVALLTLDSEVLPGWAAEHGLDGLDLAQLAEHPTVLAEIGRAVEHANSGLARVQQVKRWRLLSDEWSVDTEELTPSLKLKRRVIHRKFADVLDALYDD